MPTIAINDTYKLCPWAKFIYFCDADFWERERDKPEFAGHKGRKVTLSVEVQGKDPSALLLENLGPDYSDAECKALFDRPGAINNYGNSGAQAIQLARHLGASVILLAGFDMRDVDGRTHWSKDCLGAEQSARFYNGGGVESRDPKRYETKFAPRFPKLADALRADGITVINLTRFDREGKPWTALRCFPLASL